MACAPGRCSPPLQRLIQTPRLRTPLLRAPPLMLPRRSRRQRARLATRLLAGHAPAAEGAPGALTCAWRMDVRLGLWHMRAPRMHGRPMAIRLFVLQLQVVAMHMPA